MKFNRSLSTLTVAALVLLGAGCSSDSPSGGNGGSGLGTGGASGGSTAAATGGVVGSGGVTSRGTGGSATGGSSSVGTGGAGSGGAVNGGAGSGGSAGSSSSSGGGVSGGSAGSSSSGSGGATTGTGSTNLGTGGGVATGGGKGSGGISGTGGNSAANGGAGSGGTTGAAGTGGTTPGGPAVGSTGCGKTPTLTSGARTIQSGGQSRDFFLRIPENYDKSHPYRLIFGFHWNGGSGADVDSGGSDKDAWSYYGLRAQSENSTIFVAPTGLSAGWANTGDRDLNFVDDMIKQIEGDLCVDTTRIFSVGFSYGGGMSYELACARAKVFRAVAVYSGAQLSGCGGGADPIAYLGIHGVSDPTCNISGGRSLRDKFVKNNGCTAQSPPEPSAGSGKHTCTSYTGCSSGYPVRWCAFDGGHTPGNVDGGVDSGAKTWTKGEVWPFFTQF